MHYYLVVFGEQNSEHFQIENWLNSTSFDNQPNCTIRCFVKTKVFFFGVCRYSLLRTAKAFSISITIPILFFFATWKVRFNNLLLREMIQYYGITCISLCKIIIFSKMSLKILNFFRRWLIIWCWFMFIFISERELKFMFAICHRPSVCRLSVVCLSVTSVHPTQAIEITTLSTLAIFWHPGKILRRSTPGNPSVGGV